MVGIAEIDGAKLGDTLGLEDGFMDTVGLAVVGEGVGAFEGGSVGRIVVGVPVGISVGLDVTGEALGLDVGLDVTGAALGLCVGLRVGDRDGCIVGFGEGFGVGRPVGMAVVG